MLKLHYISAEDKACFVCPLIISEYGSKYIYKCVTNTVLIVINVKKTLLFWFLMLVRGKKYIMCKTY